MADSNFDMEKSKGTPRSSESDVSLGYWLCDDEFEEASDGTPQVVTLPRTQKLILDYKQFKAAQLIQRYVRGWLVRFRNRKFHLAAVVIQKWWRRYMAQRHLLVLVEKKLQLAVVSFYDAKATLIQKVFRGWWSRQHVNDLTKLQSLQTSLAQHIIRVLGIYLHEVKHRGQIPGFHTRHLPPKCLETIDQLMATLDYRIFNAYSCYRMQKTLSKVKHMRNAFKKSAYYTLVPFRGFDDRGVCVGRRSSLADEEKSPESTNLIRAFVCRKHDMDLKTKGTGKIPIEEAHNSAKQALHVVNSFVKRITLDMKKWHDQKGKEILPREIFKNTDTKVLLDEVKVKLEDIFGKLEPCKCGAEYADM
ncbi:hypothetical protein KR054_004266 [Drosophila jambulina]|nr:hypothetical protein KR054_004266 [Drosophila jambulina]